MPSLSLQKKLIVLTVLLVVLGGAALVLLIKSKSAPATFNPLDKIETDQIQQILIARSGVVIHFEKKDGFWQLIEPIKDWASQVQVKRLIDGLHAFSASSIISENKERYAQFELTADQAIGIKVFLNGKSDSALDVYLGKTAPGYREVYVRFEGKDPVYVASGLLPYDIRSTAQDYQERKVFARGFPDPQKLEITSGGASTKLTKSSASWVNDATQAEIPKEKADAIVSGLESWYAVALSSGGADASKYGFDKPRAVISVQNTDGACTARVGNKSPLTDNNAPPNVYVQVDGRPYALEVSAQAVDGFLTDLKALSSQ